MEKTNGLVSVLLTVLIALSSSVASAPADETPSVVQVDFSVTDITFSSDVPSEGDAVAISATVALDAPLSDGAWVKSGVVLNGQPFVSGVSYPCVIPYDTGYRMYYSGFANSQSADIYCSDSADGLAWTNQRLVLTKPSGTVYAISPTVVHAADGSYLMYFSAKYAGGSQDIFLATSQDGLSWTNADPVVHAGPDAFDSIYACQPSVVKTPSGFEMYYKGYGSGGPVFCRAVSADGVSWKKTGVVMTSGGFLNIESPWTMKTADGNYAMCFNAHSYSDGMRVSWIYSSTSADGIAWTAPVLRVQNSPGTFDSISMCSPAVLLDPARGINRLYYSGYGSGAVWQMCAADWSIPVVTSPCVVSFYIDEIATANLVSESLMTMENHRSAVATAVWTATAGTHDVFVTVAPLADTESDPSDDTACRTIVVASSAPPTPATLAIAKIKTSGIDEGVTLTYYEWDLLITVTNEGGSMAEGVVVKDVIPAELELLSFNASKGDVATDKLIRRLQAPFLGLTTKGVFAVERPAIDSAHIGVRDTRDSSIPPSPSAAPRPPVPLPVKSTHVTWTIGTLAPGEQATLALHICTRVNPGGNQEFTSPGIYSLNDGAWAEYYESTNDAKCETGRTAGISVCIIE